MSRHWKPEESGTRVRPAWRGGRVHAAGEPTPWASPQSYVEAPEAAWPDELKVAAVLAAGACARIAAGLFQAV